MGKSSLSASKRVKQFPNSGFQVKDGQLFCNICDHYVDYEKKSILVNHMKTIKHRRILGGCAEIKERQKSEALSGTETPAVELGTAHLVSSSASSIKPKVKELEMTLKLLRSEFDLKMDIIYQILTTRHEKLQAQRELMDREEKLYGTLLEQWGNGNSDQSYDFSEDVDKVNAEDLDDNIHVGFNVVNVSSPGTLRKRLRRRKRMKLERQYSDGENSENSENVQSDSENGKSVDFPVDNSVSEPSDFDEQEERKFTGKLRMRSMSDYEKEREFPSEQAAIKFVLGERQWCFRRKYEKTEGRKRYYDCKFDRKCSAKICILYEHGLSEVATVYRGTTPHTHQPWLQSGLPKLVKERIQKYMDMGITKTSQMLEKLRDEEIPEPMVPQLGNYVAAERRRRDRTNYYSTKRKFKVVVVQEGGSMIDLSDEKREQGGVKSSYEEMSTNILTEPEHIEIPCGIFPSQIGWDKN